MYATNIMGEWSSDQFRDSIHPTVIIIGLGNPILGDDGVGWRVAENIAQYLRSRVETQSLVDIENSPSTVDVDCLAVGGLSLMERLIGYQRAIIIDAVNTGEQPQGTVSVMNLSDLPERALGHLNSAHDVTLPMAIRVGRTMGAKLPDDIKIVGIETHQVFDFSETLNSEILNSIPEAVNAVMELLK